MLTVDDVREAIENCERRKDPGGATGICSDGVTCAMHILGGTGRGRDCDTLRKLYTKASEVGLQRKEE